MGNQFIPDDFLPPAPLPTAKAHRIDFTQTDPRIPHYKDLFAAVINDILTPAECDELLRLAEASTCTSEPWERAMINVGNGVQVMATDTRNCGRIIYDSPDLAGRLLARLRPFLQGYGLDRIEGQLRVTGLRGRGRVYEVSGLNERLRFLKYQGGEYFRPHWDGKYVTPDQREISYYTIHLYLNGDGEQDIAELKRAEQDGTANIDQEGKLLGGATSFIPRFEDQSAQVRVFPRTGSILLFQQNDLLHGGDPVFRGTKYTMRTDIMYRE